MKITSTLLLTGLVSSALAASALANHVYVTTDQPGMAAPDRGITVNDGRRDSLDDRRLNEQEMDEQQAGVSGDGVTRDLKQKHRARRKLDARGAGNATGASSSTSESSTETMDSTRDSTSAPAGTGQTSGY